MCWQQCLAAKCQAQCQGPQLPDNQCHIRHASSHNQLRAASRVRSVSARAASFQGLCPCKLPVLWADLLPEEMGLVFGLVLDCLPRATLNCPIRQQTAGWLKPAA
jgi:hypothetical protein